MPAPAPRPPLPAAPYNFAIGQTSANGEIKALDPANYGGVTIAKSISITGIDGAGIDRAGGPVAITINAGANDVVNLSHLTLDGLKLAQNGILLNAGGMRQRFQRAKRLRRYGEWRVHLGPRFRPACRQALAGLPRASFAAVSSRSPAKFL